MEKVPSSDGLTHDAEKTNKQTSIEQHRMWRIPRTKKLGTHAMLHGGRNPSLSELITASRC
eukprot:1440453-Amphidinium_carterae.1